jgi:ribonuclease P/MRP protein subunit POP1
MLCQRSLESASTSAGIHGFTVLVPAGWAMPFWQSLVFTGSFVIGLKERTTQYHETGLPSLPEDFSGVTSAGDDWAAKKQAELQQRWVRRPPGKRAEWLSLGTRSPWVADWPTVLASQDAEKSDGAATRSPLPWLVTAPLLRQTDEFTDVEDRSTQLLAAINIFRSKRGLSVLEDADSMLRSALLSVRIEMIGKGSPDDLSIIYRVSDQDRAQWLEAEEARKAGRRETTLGGFGEPLKTAIEVVSPLGLLVADK